jgi:hypothetical protein
VAGIIVIAFGLLGRCAPARLSALDGARRASLQGDLARAPCVRGASVSAASSLVTGLVTCPTGRAVSARGKLRQGRGVPPRPC